MTEISITTHAYERANERLSWSKKILDKMALKAYSQGKTHSETKGHLNRYISKLYLQYKSANNTKVYGENVYIFCNNTLITVYKLPNDLLKYVKL